MAKFKPVTISVPVEKAQELAFKWQLEAYVADENRRLIIETILANKEKTAGEIRWLIMKDSHKEIGNRKSPSAKRIINMAKRIGIDLKK